MFCSLANSHGVTVDFSKRAVYSINLDGSKRVRDEHLASLLQVWGTPVTAEGIALLKAALPDLKIES